MPVDYGYLISRSWQITWRNKVLLSTGWSTLRSHLGPSIITGLIQLGIGLIFVLVMFMLLLPLIAVFSVGSFFQGENLSAITVLTAFVVGIVLWVVAAALSAIPTAFFSVMWTELYLTLRGLASRTEYPAAQPVQPY